MTQSSPIAVQSAPAVDILGVPVSRINLPSAVRIILDTIARGQAQYVCVRDVHGVMRSVKDAAMMDIQRGAGLVTPDGMPLVWVARMRGYRDIGRVAGADLMEALCDASQGTGISHFFYGGREGVAERLISVLHARFPDMTIGGSYCPPFRVQDQTEDAAVTSLIRDSGAKIVWVGVSTPKQEYWMRAHVEQLPGATLLGVGAAFDFHAGAVKRAPRWMHGTGLEWIHRLASDPRRLWRRYLIMAPQFVFQVACESMAIWRKRA